MTWHILSYTANLTLPGPDTGPSPVTYLLPVGLLIAIAVVLAVIVAIVLTRIYITKHQHIYEDVIAGEYKITAVQ